MVVILNKLADQISVQINVQRSRHDSTSLLHIPLRLFVRRWRSQGHCDAQRIDDGEDLAELARCLPFFQFNNESQTRARCHRQVSLGHPQASSSVFDQLANLFGCESHISSSCSTARSRAGILCDKLVKSTRKFPCGNVSCFMRPNMTVIPERERSHENKLPSLSPTTRNSARG